ncbi:MAG: TraB/GumN family protein [Candidatus Hadarchaeota archaeon]
MRKIGNNFFLLGVAHVLPSSMAEVKETIERERPDIVAVELDAARYLALLQGEQQNTVKNLRAGMRLSIMSVIMYIIQSRFSKQTGMPAGTEMLEAIKAAGEVGARVELVDQEIGVTLRRLNEAVPPGEKARIFAQLLISFIPFQGRPKLSSLTEDEVVDFLLHEFKEVSPKTHEVLISERDSYMASRLLHLMNSGKVVCVVGAGHVPGIYKLLEEAVGGWGVKLEYRSG